MAEVLLEQVGKTYGSDIRAVETMDLSIGDGEFLVLVGPSGCGKSTTLRMIAGLEEITDGRISIGGRVVNDVHASERDIAMVFQNYALYPHMTVARNLSFGLERRRAHGSRLRSFFSRSYRQARREETEAIRARVREAAGTLGIEALLERHPRELSGGQRQRVALGRALVRNPKAFLFDEPLSNLDAKLRVEMRTELRILHRDLDATMIYVTHDQEEAMTLGDRLVVMSDGVVQQVDTPARVYERPANRFVAGFVGTPSMNFIEGRIDEAGRFVGEGVSITLPDAVGSRTPGECTLGVRPDAFEPSQGGAGAIPCSVRAIEYLGDRVDLVLDSKVGQLVCRTAPVTGLSEGDDLHLTPTGAGVHLFEAGPAGARRA